MCIIVLIILSDITAWHEMTFECLTSVARGDYTGQEMDLFELEELKVLGSAILSYCHCPLSRMACCMNIFQGSFCDPEIVRVHLFRSYGPQTTKNN
jgi:hypothetical protein